MNKLQTAFRDLWVKNFDLLSTAVNAGKYNFDQAAPNNPEVHQQRYNRLESEDDVDSDYESSSDSELDWENESFRSNASSSFYHPDNEDEAIDVQYDYLVSQPPPYGIERDEVNRSLATGNGVGGAVAAMAIASWERQNRGWY